MRAVKRIELAERDRVQLERIVRAAKSEACMIELAQIVPCASQGLNGLEIAERVGCSEPTVIKWRSRYARDGIDGLRDAPPKPTNRMNH